MTRCATMIDDHLGRESQCSREENHLGNHCANVTAGGNAQLVFAKNHEFDKNVIPYSMVVTIKADDAVAECESCGITYIKHEFMGGYCTHCSFWLSKARDFKKSRSENITGSEEASLVTNDYDFFSICPSDTRGFGGAHFSVGLLGSDETVEIAGPWYCGTVPTHLREQFEPNVRFVTLKA